MAIDPKSKKKVSFLAILAWFCLGALLILVAMPAIPRSGPQKRGTQVKSDNQMRQIALAAVMYRNDHNGAFPQFLSMLVPDYVPEPSLFYLPSSYNAAFIPSAANSEPKLIDAFSSYSLLVLKDGRAVIFERSVIWPDHKIGFLIIANDLTHSDMPKRVSLEDFALLCAGSFKP